MQDIEIGDKFFDDEFIIKGNSEHKIKQLLEDDELKQLIRSQPDIQLTIQDDEGWFGEHFPQGVDQLYFSAYYFRDVRQLENLFNLFATALERLVQIDSAYENDPKVKLG